MADSDESAGGRAGGPRAGRPAMNWRRAVHALFSSPGNALLTLLALAVLWWIAVPLIRFALVDAVWRGGVEACRKPGVGACWPFIEAHIGQFIYGGYPLAARWRVDAALLIGAGLLLPLLWRRVPAKRLNAVLLLAGFPVIAFVLLRGGMLGLASVEPELWGGLMLTLIVAATGITLAVPIGVLLALARQSELPVLRVLASLFIETWRGVPLITVLFMASVMLPLFLPEGSRIERLYGALVGVAMFAGAYMAEVIRGGLAAVPRGQVQAAAALGMPRRTALVYVVLPQALRHAIPGMVNSSVGLLKDTTLVLTIGLFDLLGIVQRSFTNAAWASPVTASTGYLFVGLVFWVLCFSLSRYALGVERRLARGRF